MHDRGKVNVSFHHLLPRKTKLPNRKIRQFEEIRIRGSPVQGGQFYESVSMGCGALSC